MNTMWRTTTNEQRTTILNILLPSTHTQRPLYPQTSQIQKPQNQSQQMKTLTFVKKKDNESLGILEITVETCVFSLFIL
jgi:hypothetical protein